MKLLRGDSFRDAAAGNTIAADFTVAAQIINRACLCD
jgi:hypothetical protein